MEEKEILKVMEGENWHQELRAHPCAARDDRPGWILVSRIKRAETGEAYGHQSDDSCVVDGSLAEPSRRSDFNATRIPKPRKPAANTNDSVQ
jgi:hypothetical protein